MSRTIGTVSRGVRAPIIRNGDNIAEIVTNCILESSRVENIPVRDRDVVAMTEAIVARAQGNYCTVDDIATDIKAKFGGETMAVILPILSRNRFSVCLTGIARGAKKIVLMLSYPSDEVGNHLVSLDKVDEMGVNPYSDVLTLEKYRELFGYEKHRFTGVDYVEFYEELIRAEGADCEIIFANDPRAVLPYTKKVLTCDIHTRHRSKRLLKAAGAEIVYGLDDILTALDKYEGMRETAIIISFDGVILEKLRNLDEDIELWYLTHEITEEQIVLAKMNNYAIGFNCRKYDEKMLRKAQGENINLATWTVDSTKLYEELYNLGIRNFTTNRLVK